VLRLRSYFAAATAITGAGITLNQGLIMNLSIFVVGLGAVAIVGMIGFASYKIACVVSEYDADAFGDWPGNGFSVTFDEYEDCA